MTFRRSTFLFPVIAVGIFTCSVSGVFAAAWDNDPGVIWNYDALDEYVGPVARNWSTWYQGTGDREWNWLPGESGWGQEVKKSNVRVGIYRENRGFISGDRYRIKVRAKLHAGIGTPSTAIGIHPTGGTDPNGVVYGSSVQMTQVGQWVDVTYEFVASNWTATIFLKADFTDVYDGSIIFDNVSVEATYLPGQPTRTPKPWMPVGALPVEPAYIYGMHDAGAEHLFNQKNRKGWVMHAIGIGDDPNDYSGWRFSEWVDGHGVIARISYDFGYTLPHPDRFDEFAQRCANFVSNSVGCGIWSIANEPGLETAGGVPITPEIYADAYIQCRNAIKAVMPSARVITCGFVQGSFDFFEDTLELLEEQCDGIAIHSYTNANYWHEANFNLYRQHMALIPQSMRNLPVYMTEAGNGAAGPYPDQNNGFVNHMFENVHSWNQDPAHQPVRSVNFYRWRNWDQWGIETKQGMIDDFLDALVPDRYWRDPSADTATATPTGLVAGTPTPTGGAGPATPTNTPEPPPSTPVVQEPSFEGSLSPWSMWIGSGSNGDWIERDYLGGVAYDGVWGLGVKGIGSGGKGAYQYISDGWMSGHIYRLSVWCKNIAGSAMDYSIGYKLGNGGSGGESATYGDAVSAPGSWTQATVEFTYSGSQGATLYLRAVNAGHSERAGFDLVEITDLGSGGPEPTNTPTSASAGTPTPTPESGPIAAEDFETMPSWSSFWDATWGSAANWSIASGGESGNYLQSSRSSEGSSAKVLVYNVPTNTDIEISVYMRCPNIGGTYWMETAYRLGNHTAQDFDQNAGAWTMIKKFSNDTQNGNGNTWTYYSKEINTGSSSQISIGFKLGSSGGGTPAVGWDTLRIEEAESFGWMVRPSIHIYGRLESRPGMFELESRVPLYPSRDG